MKTFRPNGNSASTQTSDSWVAVDLSASRVARFLNLSATGGVEVTVSTSTDPNTDPGVQKVFWLAPNEALYVDLQDFASAGGVQNFYMQVLELSAPVSGYYTTLSVTGGDWA
jgi:hypothetical protein